MTHECLSMTWHDRKYVCYVSLLLARLSNDAMHTVDISQEARAETPALNSLPAVSTKQIYCVYCENQYTQETGLGQRISNTIHQWDKLYISNNESFPHRVSQAKAASFFPIWRKLMEKKCWLAGFVWVATHHRRVTSTGLKQWSTSICCVRRQQGQVSGRNAWGEKLQTHSVNEASCQGRDTVAFVRERRNSFLGGLHECPHFKCHPHWISPTSKTLRIFLVVTKSWKELPSATWSGAVTHEISWQEYGAF